MSNWKEKFDEEFNVHTNGDLLGADLDPSYVKAFIAQTLKEEREEIVRELEETGMCNAPLGVKYLEGLEDAINLIKGGN